MMKYSYNWDDGEENGWELSDQLTRPHVRHKKFGWTDNKAYWGLSNEVYVSPPYSLQCITSDAIHHHISAFRPALPYIPADYMSLSTSFLIPDISVFGSIEFFMNRHTGTERRTPGVQWRHRFNNLGYWLYWKGGAYGRHNIGVWTKVLGSEMDFKSNIWYNVVVEAKVMSTYVRLKIRDVTEGVVVADYNLSDLPVSPAPPGARSSTWPAQVNCGVAQTSSKFGGIQTVYIDDVEFAVATSARA